MGLNQQWSSAAEDVARACIDSKQSVVQYSKCEVQRDVAGMEVRRQLMRSRLAAEGGWPVRAKLGTAFPVGHTGGDSCEVVVGRKGDAAWPPVIVEERPYADLVSPALTLPKHPGGQQGAVTRSEEAARGSAEVAVDIWRSIEAASGL